MATTKYRLAEQALRRLKSGRPDNASGIRIEELMLAAGQIANMLIKATHFNQTLANGDTVPDSCVIGTYPDIAVSSYKNVSRATIPCMPINLLRGQGIQQVGSNADEFCQFIPMQANDFIMLKSQPLINGLLGYIGYKWEGLDLIFYEDITKRNPAITSVEVKMLVLDMETYDDYAPLPLPADYEGQIIDTLFKQFAQIGQSSPATDLLTEEPAK